MAKKKAKTHPAAVLIEKEYAEAKKAYAAAYKAVDDFDEEGTRERLEAECSDAEDRASSLQRILEEMHYVDFCKVPGPI